MKVFTKERMLRKKFIKSTLDELMPHQHLARCLTSVDLTLLGIGAIIGAGIFILTGVVAATQAGPAVILSFVLASIACLFSALSYAELATTVGGCGSAYGYAYAGFGQIFAWIIGWDLILEYGVSVATVAIGWSSYCRDVLHAAGWNLPTKLLTTPFDGGIINLPAVLIVLFLTGLLILGVKAGARFNAVIVLIKLIAIALFIWVACLNVNLRNWQHFMPFGWVGVVNGASLIFFAYIGFDAVSTAAEEAKNPQRDLPRSIILSLLICTLVYVAVSGLLTLMTPYTTLNTASPVADIVLRFGYRMTASFIAVGALAGLTTVMLVMFYGLSRIMLAMSRDVLLPKIMSHLNKHTKTPARIIFFAGCLITILAGLLPIRTAAEMVNIGTLAAFLCVNLGTIILRHTQPNIPRPFRVPFGYFLPTLGVFFCLYLMLHLPWVTWVRFFGWMLLGLVFYWYQAKRHLIQ